MLSGDIFMKKESNSYERMSILVSHNIHLEVLNMISMITWTILKLFANHLLMVDMKNIQ